MKDRIRAVMIRYPRAKIWDEKAFKDWNEKDYERFNFLETSIKPIKIKNHFKSKKVIRISDGKIYPSISKCRFENKISKNGIDKMIKESIKFKIL